MPKIKSKTPADLTKLRQRQLASKVALAEQTVARLNESTIPKAEFDRLALEARAILHEEAKKLMETDHYRVFIERVQVVLESRQTNQ